MRALSGLLRPVSGGIALAREELAQLPAHRVAARGLVLVPEGRQVFPELSVLDNLRLGAYLRKDAADADVEAMLERFPRLRERLHQRAGLLSGGEQQMLAVGRALARKPKLLLLDELSLGLAPVIVERLLPVVRDYARESGCGVLLVEQHVQLALTIADRGYVLSHGEILLHEKAEALRANRQLLVASYLGEQEVETSQDAGT
jgi:branched-chain amino acid transport system ATP-binding protein